MKNEALYRALGALETEESTRDASQAGRIAARARQLAGLAQESAPRPAQNPRRKRRWKLALAAAALLALTACAVAAFSSDWFKSYTPPGDPRQASALLAEIGTAVGESRTAGDYTVTLLGTINDGYDAVIAFSVEPQREGAAALDSRCVFAENLLMREELLLGLEEAGETDFPRELLGAQSLRLERWPSEEEPGALLFTARYQLKNLVAAGALQEPAEEAVYRFSLRGLGRPGEEPLAEGPWEFSVTLSPSPRSRDLPLDRIPDGRQGNAPAMLRITPLNLALIWDAAEEPSPGAAGPQAVLLADGQQVARDEGWTTTNQTGDETICASGCALARVIDPEQVRAVQIGEGWYRLEQSGERWALRAEE